MSYLLRLVRDPRACRALSKITKRQYLREGLSFFVYLLHVVTYIWKLQCYHAVLIGYGPAKFSEITNGQCLWKGLSDFVDLLDIH